MSTTRIALLLGLLAATLLPLRAEDDAALKKELTRLQGAWAMVSGSADGQPMPAQLVKQMKRVCHGDQTTTSMSGRIYFKATIRLDPSQSPKHIDYQMTEGFSKGQKQLGIYEVEGDTFKSCFSKPGAERPTDFSSTPGDGRTLSVWKRDKPAAPAPPQI